MFEYVKDAKLKPEKKQRPRSKTDLIVIHQVEGNMTPQQIHDYHISKGYSGGIAYNIYVGKDGEVYWGRGLEAEGGGVKNSGISSGVNQRCVAIVCNGNFNAGSMSDVQFQALIKVTRDVMTHYKLNVSQVKGHREVGDSDCPGRYFPLDQLRNVLSQTSLPEPTVDLLVRPTDPASPNFDIIVDILSSQVPITKVEVDIIYGAEVKRIALKQNSKNQLHYAKRVNIEKAFPGQKGTFTIQARINDKKNKAATTLTMGG